MLKTKPKESTVELSEETKKQVDQSCYQLSISSDNHYDRVIMELYDDLSTIAGEYADTHSALTQTLANFNAAERILIRLYKSMYVKHGFDEVEADDYAQSLFIKTLDNELEKVGK